MKHRASRSVITFLASSAFFWGVLGFFVLESLWIVFSAVYPMAFDEDFHFGLIKLYSHYWLPFISHQPAGANVYGAVVNNPSYLYHYAMSFPYRVIAMMTSDQTVQVIWLRLINVGLFGFALLLFRKVLLRAKLGASFTNLIILLFVLIPIVPMLAGEINYDNLTMVLVAVVCLLVERIIPQVHARKVPLRDISLLASVGLLGSIVKYAFLPVLAASAIVTAILLWVSFNHNLPAIWHATCKACTTLGKRARILLLLVVLVSLGLFSQRYLTNLAAYKTPIPRCDRVLTVDDCMSYGPFARTYTLKQTKSPAFKAHVLSYIPQWFYGMWYRTFFSVNGNVPSPSWARYETIPPLKLPSITAVVLVVATLPLLVIYGKRLLSDWLLIFLALMVVLYALALFIDNYGSYRMSGQPVAINGRYLLPMILPLAVLAGRAWQLALQHHDKAKLVFAGLAVLMFVEGGGVLTFMIESNYTWYWSDHRAQTANFDAQVVAKKIVLVNQPLYIHTP